MDAFYPPEDEIVAPSSPSGDEGQTALSDSALQKKRMCAAPGCRTIVNTKRSSNQMYCAEHTKGRKVCSEPSCNRFARKNGMCHRHNQFNRICIIKGCRVQADVGDRCKEHAKSNSGACQFPGCKSLTRVGDFCMKHKKRPDDRRRSTGDRKSCQWPDCTTLHRTGCQGYCKFHFKVRAAFAGLQPQGAEFIDGIVKGRIARAPLVPESPVSPSLDDGPLSSSPHRPETGEKTLPGFFVHGVYLSPERNPDSGPSSSSYQGSAESDNENSSMPAPSSDMDEE